MKRKIFTIAVMVFTLIFSVTALADYERIADNTVPAYQDPGLTNRTGNERVDRGDRVIVHEETANAYRVTYPTPKGSKTRWVPKNIFNGGGNNGGDVKQKLLNAVFQNGSARITCDFDGYKNTSGRHEGIDMVLYHNAPVYSPISGIVTRADEAFNTVAIYDESNNKTVVFLHFNSVAVSVGQRIGRGTLVGYQGSNGASSSHVHIEVRDGRRTAAVKSVNDPKLDNPNPYDYWNRVL